MKEPILHKARIKPILDKNYNIVCDADDYAKINQLIREKTISAINALYVPKEIYTLSIDLLDLPEYEFSYKDSFIDYNKLISCLQKKLSTNQNIILIGSTRGWYSYLNNHVCITAMTNIPVIDSDRFGYYLKIYVCVGKESIEPWLTDEQLKLLNSRKEHLKASKIFETMYLPSMINNIKKISPDLTIVHEQGIYDEYKVSIPTGVLKSIVYNAISKYFDDALKENGIETRFYYNFYHDMEIYFNLKNFTKNIFNNEKVEV